MINTFEATNQNNFRSSQKDIIIEEPVLENLAPQLKKIKSKVEYTHFAHQFDHQYKTFLNASISDQAELVTFILLLILLLQFLRIKFSTSS